jgi:hypothetical protein
MHFHALFDCFFSSEVQERRRRDRSYFVKLMELSPEQWTVNLSEYGPFFRVTDHSGNLTTSEKVFWGYSLDGVRAYACVLRRSSGTAECTLRGRFESDYHPLSLGPTSTNRSIECCYVDTLYRHLCKTLKRAIDEVRRDGKVHHRNRIMEADYERYVRSIRGL